MAVNVQVEDTSSWFGNVCKAAEVDGFVSLGKDLLMISAKRQHAQQAWHASFLNHLTAMASEWN